MKRHILPVLFFLFYGTGNAQLFFETFNYSAGNLIGQGGWAQAQGGSDNFQVVSPSLTFTDYAFSDDGNAVNIQGPSSGIEQEYTSLGSIVNSGDLYCSFLINVSSAPSTPDYIFGFIPSTESSTYLGGRLFIQDDGSGNLEFGIHASVGAIAQAFTNNSYQFNTTYLLVLKYSFIAGVDNNELSLYVIPSGSSIPSTEPTPTLGPVVAQADEDNDDINRIAVIARVSEVIAKMDGMKISDSWASLFTITGVSSASNQSIVTVYPNPTKNTIYFSNPVSVEIMNSTGVLLIRKEDIESLDVSNLAKGLYIVKCSLGERIESKVIVVE